MKAFPVFLAALSVASAGVIPHATKVIGTITTQHHSQDELGQYSYGYSGGPSAKEEIKTADGVTRGGYSYVDGNGLVQSAAYVSDPVNGFRVAATNLPAGPAVPAHDQVIAVAPATVNTVQPVVPVTTQVRTVVAAPAPAVVAAPVPAPSFVAPVATVEAHAAAKAAVEAEIKATVEAEAETAQAVADAAQAEADHIQAQADAVRAAADDIQSADEIVKTVPVAVAPSTVVVSDGGASIAAAAVANAEAARHEAVIEDQIALEGARRAAVAESSSLGVISVPSQIKTVAAVESVAPAVVVSSTPRPSFEEIKIVSTPAPVVQRIYGDIPAPVYESPVITPVVASAAAPPSTVISSAVVSSVGPAHVVASPARVIAPSSGVIAKEVIPVVKTPVVAPPPTVALEHPGQITSQYHSQDELGQYSYGYAGGPSAKEEIKTADGVTKGGYAYIDAHGLVQQAAYVSDPVNGFRIAATNLPKQPLPEYIPDSPEVEHAKHQLFQLQAEHIAKL